MADSDIETGGAPQSAQLASQVSAAAAPPTGRASRKAAMPFIMVAVLIDMISIGLMVPVLPHIVGQFTASNDEQIARELGQIDALHATIQPGPTTRELLDQGRQP